MFYVFYVYDYYNLYVFLCLSIGVFVSSKQMFQWVFIQFLNFKLSKFELKKKPLKTFQLILNFVRLHFPSHFLSFSHTHTHTHNNK